MCLEKSSNLGVKEVICRTILENRLTIVCIQEIIDPLALHDLCDELNRPRLRRVAEWKPNTRNWKYAISAGCADGQLNGLGFIYNADSCDLIREDCLDISLDAIDVDCPIAPSAYLASFRFSDWTCQVLNTYLRYFDLSQVDRVISTVEQRLQQHHAAQSLQEIFIVAGDFSDTTIDAEQPAYLSSTKQRTSKLPSLAPRSTARDLDLKHLGLFNVIEPNSSAFHSQQQQRQDKPPTGAGKTATKPSNRITPPSSSSSSVLSSCNILCRERMPATRSAFREALYKTKTPLSIIGDLQQNGQIDGLDVSMADRLCGYWGVVRQGLCHMAIPNGFRWGGSVSQHCPVWVEMYKCRERTESSIELPVNGSLDEQQNTEGEGSAAAKRQLYKRRGSISSNVSYHRMNGNTISGGGGRNYLHNQTMPVPGVLLTNGGGGGLNDSSDSVFLDN